MRNKLTAVLLLSSASMALAIPAQAIPAPILSGYVDASIAWGNASDSYHETYNGDSEGNYHYSNNINTLSAWGAANALWSDGTGVQIDLGHSSTSLSHDNYEYTSNDLGAHLYQRSDDMLWGGFASIGDANGDGRYATFGLEAQRFCNDWTFYGQFSWSKGVSGYAQFGNYQSWNAHVEARYFYTDHLMFSAGFGWDWGSYNEKEDYGYYHYTGNPQYGQWDLRVEYLLSDLPVSFYASYQGSYDPYNEKENYDYGDEIYKYKGHYNTSLFMIGARLYLDQNSLLTNDRTGATLRDFNPWTGVQPAIYGEGD